MISIVVLLYFLDFGISRFPESPSNASKIIERCIEDVALEKVPKHIRHHTPIYVGATAGMRLLWLVPCNCKLIFYDILCMDRIKCFSGVVLRLLQTWLSTSFLIPRHKVYSAPTCQALKFTCQKNSSRETNQTTRRIFF